MARAPHHQPFQLAYGQFRLRGERQSLRDSGVPAALRVLRPALGHVRIEIGLRLPERGDQGSEHPGHAALRLPGDFGMLGRDAGSAPAFLQVGGLVDRPPGADQVIREPLRRHGNMRVPRLLPRPHYTE
jgi:hypothetical protein